MPKVHHPFESIYLQFARKPVYTFQIRCISTDRDFVLLLCFLLFSYEKFSVFKWDMGPMKDEHWTCAHVSFGQNGYTLQMSSILTCIREKPFSLALDPGFMKYVRENYLKLLPFFHYPYNQTFAHIWEIHIYFLFVLKWCNHAFIHFLRAHPLSHWIQNLKSPNLLPIKWMRSSFDFHFLHETFLSAN